MGKLTDEQRVNIRINNFIKKGKLVFDDPRINDFKRIILLSFKGEAKNLVKHFIENDVHSNLIERAIKANSLKSGVFLEKFLIKYEENQAIEKWNSYREKQALTNTFEYKHKKYGMTKEEFKQYNKNRSATKENFIMRHGEKEGTKRWEEYCSRQSFAGCKEKYFIEKYGKIKGKEKYKNICAKKAHTLKNYIEKYGETDGTIRYENYISRKPSFYSLISQELFWEIYENLTENLQEKTYFGELNHEYGKMNDKSYYKVDFCVSSLKYIIEFNGDYWHGNPEKYNLTEILPVTGKTYEEIHKKDSEKNNFFKSLGFDVDIIWEKDYVENKEKIVSEILRKIKDHEIQKNK
jgi:very-short-patch-repair endonuclease